MIKKEHIKSIESVQNWEEAIRIAAESLLQDQSITENYVQKMISNVREMGPYIVISNDIAIPHARPEDGVLKTAVAILKLKNRVGCRVESRRAIRFHPEWTAVGRK